MKTKHYLLTENQTIAIAVISAKTDKELNEKTKLALSDHFDCELNADLKLNLVMETYEYGNCGEFHVNLDDYSEIITIEKIEVY